jgi:hypothetical protein
VRARNIKPGFFKNEELSVKDPLARILFQGLWCMADREGRLEDRPARIKAEILPYDDCNVDSLLNSLASGEDPFILRYESDGRRFIQVIHFIKHQNPHWRENESTMPAPDKPQASPGLTQGKPQASLRQASDKPKSSPADSLIPDSLNSLSKDKQPVAAYLSTGTDLAGKTSPPQGDHFMAHIDDVKLRGEIKEVVGAIDLKRFNAYRWCQAKFSEKKFNAKAILYTLTRIAKEQELKRDLWPYANKIYEVEYGKFNERDHIERSREYKQDYSRAELVSIGAVLGRMAKPP